MIGIPAAAVSAEDGMVVAGFEAQKERKSVAVRLVFEWGVRSVGEVPRWDH